MSRRHLAAVPDQPRRVILYVRVSALFGRGGEDFHSPEMQLTAMRRLTAGMEVVDVIDDDIDQTGRTFDREGIDKIRRLAESKAIDAIAVYNLSRFGRNVLESLQFLNWLADRGVTILSASEQVDTSTPTGRWMLTNLLALAEMQSDQIGAEWSRAIAARARAGKPHGRANTGYMRDEHGRLTPHPVVGPVVTRAFTRYADGGELRPLRRELQAVTGLQVPTATIKNMFRNRVYLGALTIRSGGGIVEVPDAHPALTDEPTWERVQQRLAADATAAPASYAQPRYPLTGLVRCGLCLGVLNHRVDKPSGRVRVFCRSHAEKLGNGCTGCGGLAQDSITEVVLEKIRDHIRRLRGDVGAEAAHQARTTRAGVGVASVEAELAATRKAMARTTERWARQKMKDPVYEETMKALTKDESDLMQTLTQLREVAGVPKPGEVVALAEELLALWPEMDGSQQNRALKGLVRAVIVAPAASYRQPADGRVEVEWR